MVDLINKVNARAQILSNNYAVATEHVLGTETMQIRQGGEEVHCKAQVNFQDSDIPKGVRGSIKSHGMEFAKEEKLNNIDVFGNQISEYGAPPVTKFNSVGQRGQEERFTAPRICWERILPQRYLKVLLVEDDDSTRQVVSAMLRRCGYEVTAVANGLQAWNLLEDESNHFNLVLTEVVMPCLSGIGLLDKIISHQKCKNIPVIMMSSHDSIAIVFKCLTKGAADFLIKPVRKNELKNIWKHVWKKCRNSSGSGSGSGSGSDCHSQKPAMLESATDSANNIGSNEESDNGASVRRIRETLRLKNVTGSCRKTGSNEKNDNDDRHLNTRDGSDNGSGTQRGDCKLGQNHGSTCAQLAEPKKEKHQDDCKLFGTSEEWQDKKTDYATGLDLEIAVPKQAATDLHCSQETEAIFGQACAMEEDAPSLSSRDGAQGYHSLIASYGNECGIPYTEAVDLIGTIARKTVGRNAEMNDLGTTTEILDKRPNSSSGKDKTVSDSNFLPLLELSLKRPLPNSDEDGELKNRCVLRQSDVSAFSRYNTKCSRVSHPSGGSFSANVYSPPTGSRHLCMPSDTQGTAHARSPYLVIPFERTVSVKKCGGDVSTHAPLQFQFCHGSNYQDMSSVVGSSGQDKFPIPGPMNDDMASASCVAPHVELSMSRPLQVMPYDSVPPANGVAFHAMSYSQLSTPSRNSTKPNTIENADKYESSTHPEQKIMSPRTQQHSHHHNHHYHHHIQHHDHHHKQLHQNSEQNEQIMNSSVMMQVPQSSNMIDRTLEGTHMESGSNGNGNESVNKLPSEVNDHINGKIDHYNHHHHHVHHHHHHHQHQSQEYKHEHQRSKQDEQIMNSSALTGLQYGTSNNGRTGCNNGYGNGSRSDHGSDNGIIGQNGHSNGQGSAVITLRMNGESGSVNGVTSGIGASGGGVDQNRFTQREAALTKFRQKRSERCFEKKVRYQSRKRLAEQRPRVRGQFVRQVVCESTTAKADLTDIL